MALRIRVETAATDSTSNAVCVGMNMSTLMQRMKYLLDTKGITTTIEHFHISAYQAKRMHMLKALCHPISQNI